jgi:hypothetical protein
MISRLWILSGQHPRPRFRSTARYANIEVLKGQPNELYPSREPRRYKTLGNKFTRPIRICVAMQLINPIHGTLSKLSIVILRQVQTNIFIA